MVNVLLADIPLKPIMWSAQIVNNDLKIFVLPVITLLTLRGVYALTVQHLLYLRALQDAEVMLAPRVFVKLYAKQICL